MQKIQRAIGKASGVAVGEPNSSGTMSIEGGGLSTFAGLVTARRGKPFTLLSINKNTYRSILGAAFHPKEQPGHYEPLRHVNQAVEGGAGYVVRVVPSDMEIPFVKLSTPGNSTQPVRPAAIDASLSTFTAFPGSVVGDGHTAIALTFSPKDASGAAIKGLSHITFDITGVTVQIDRVVERNGVYTANLTGIIPGSAFIRPMVANKAIGNLNVQITINQMPSQVATLDPEQCQFYLSNSRVYADGKSSITLYLRLRDTNGSPISIVENRVAFSGLGNIQVSITQASENQTDPGLYTARLSGVEVGNLIVLPTVDGGLIGDIKGEIVYLDKAPNVGDSSNVVDGDQSRLVASKTKISADGSDTATFTFTARNKAGSLVGGLARALTVAVYNLTGTQISAFTESSTGVYTADMTVSRSSVGDRAEIRVLNGGYTVGDLNVVLTVERIKEELPVVDDAASSFSASANQAFATGGVGASSVVTLTLSLVDVQNQPMSHRAVTFDLAGTANMGAIREETAGVYQVDVYSYNVSNVNVVPELDGLPIGTFSADIAFIAPPVKVPVIDEDRTGKTFTVAPASIPADNTTASTLSLHVVDMDGDSMTGLEASLGLSANIPGLTLGDWLEGSAGFYTAKVVSATEGTFVLTPQHNGSALGSVSRTLEVTKVVNNPDPSKSKIEVSPTSINDDGSETATLTLTLKNSSGKVIGGVANRVGFEADDMQYVSITEAVESGANSGIYTSVVTGKSVRGTVVIRPQYDGVQIGNRSVTLELHDPASVKPPVTVVLSDSTLTVDKTQIRADKSERATLTFTALDASGVAVMEPLLPHLTFKPAANTGYSVSPIASHNNGVYSATVEATGVTSNGDITIDVMYDGKPVLVNGKALTVTVKMVGAVDETASTLALSQSQIDAGGVAKSVVSYTPKDVNGNVIENVVVAFTYGGLNASDLVKGTINHTSGVFSQELSSNIPGVISIGVTVDAAPMAATQTLTIKNVVDEGTSTMTANPTTLVGDGVAKTILTLTVKDASGAGIAGIADHVRLRGNDGAQETDLGRQTMTDGGNGVYTVEYSLLVTADTALTVTPVVFGSDLGAIATTVTFTRPKATVPVASDSTFTSDLTTGTDAKIDGTPVTFTVELKNGQDKISGRSVAFALTPSELSTTTVSSLSETALDSGIYTGTIRATAADEFTVAITVDGAAFGLTPIRVKFAPPAVVIPTEPVVGDSTFAGSAPSVIADGTEKVTLTLALKAGTTPIKGKQVVFVAASKKGTTTIGTVTESPDGTYKADVTATAVDAFDVTVTVGGTAFAVAAVHVAFTKAPAVVADSTFTASAKVAVGSTPVKLTLTLKHGSALVEGETVTFESAAKKSTTTIGAVTEVAGVYSADVTASAADSFNDVVVKIGGTVFGIASPTVAFDAPAHVAPTVPAVGDSTFVSDLTGGTKGVADNTTPVNVTLTLKAGAELVTGRAVTLEPAATNADVTIGAMTETPAGSGIYKAAVTAKAATTVSIKVKVDGNDFAIAPLAVEFA